VGLGLSSVQHTYADEGATGQYTVTLTVDDGQGGSASQSATVTVSNVADPASRCEVPRGNGVAGIGNGGATSQVSLDLTSTNGTMQMDAVTPEGNGDWSQTYTDLEVGTYTVTGSCDVLIVDPTGGFSPDRAGPFTYIPVEFVVKAPSGTTAGGADTEQPAPGGGAVRATPSFTG